MKIIKPYTEFYGEVPTDYENALLFIEKAGRLCYKSEDKIQDGSAEKFTRKLISSGHLAMVEHSNFVVKLRVSDLREAASILILAGKYLNVVGSSTDIVYIGGNLTAWFQQGEACSWNHKVFAPFRKVYSNLFFPNVPGYLLEDLPEGCEICPHDEVPKDLKRYSVKFVCDRGVSHELVRHRPCSFCLSGNTEIRSFAKDGGGKSWTLKQLYDWSLDPKRAGRLRLIRIRSVDDEGRLVPGKIKQVMYSGKKYTYSLKTKGGKELVSSADHLIKTTQGWKKLKDISVGERVLANSKKVALNEDWLRDQYLEKNKTRKEVALLSGCCEATIFKAFKRFNIFKPWADRPNRQPGYGKKGMFSEEQIESMRAVKIGSKNPGWEGDNATPSGGRSRANRNYPDIGSCWGCGKATKIERHHLDENPCNNQIENILPLCQKCHKSFHLGQGVRAVYYDEVTSITPLQEEDTYDIEMEKHPHNFVADGILVHNSQESTRYVNYKDKDMEFIEPWWWGEEKNKHVISLFKAMCVDTESAYKQLIGYGQTPQAARANLTNALKTEVIVTADLEEWKHIFKLRCAPGAHPDFRRLAIPLQEEFIAKGIM